MTRRPPVRSRVRSLRNAPHWAALALGLLAAGAAPARGDRVIFKDGRTLETVVIGQDDVYVIVKDGAAQNRIPRTRVAEVIQGTAADNEALKAKGALAAGRVIEALPGLSRAAANGADLSVISSMMLQFDDAISEAAPRLEATDREAFAELIEKLGQAESDRPAPLLAARARWSLLIDNPKALTPLLDDLQRIDPVFAFSGRKELQASISERADKALELKDFATALELIRNLKRFDRDRAGAMRVEMALLWARSERDKGDFERALAIYAEQLLDESPAIGQDRMRLTMEEAEKAYRESQKLDRAIAIYERHGMKIDPEGAKKKISELWQEIGWALLRQNDTEKARATFNRANAVAPGSADRALRLCDYQESRGGLDEHDHIGHYKLGEWCAQAGLTREARDEFALAAASGTLREAALEQIESIENLESEKELHRLLDLYESGQLIDLLRQIRAFESRRLPEGLVKQAEQLERLTRDAMVANQLERPQQAEVLMQQAERAYWTGDHQTAYNMLSALLESFTDTPAAARGLKFYRAIKPRLDLERLERRRKTQPALTELGDEYRDIAEGGETATGDISEEIRRLRERAGRSAEALKAAGGAAPGAPPIADPDAALPDDTVGGHRDISGEDPGATTRAELKTTAKPKAEKAAAAGAGRAGDKAGKVEAEKAEAEKEDKPIPLPEDPLIDEAIKTLKTGKKPRE